MSRNSKVILAKNIKLDKNYKSVLKISESDMITLMSNSSNLVYQNNTFSFLRDSRNSIQLKASYSSCIQANYIAFQNPDYSNKWFFGFIDSIKYISESVTQIDFTTDIFTTWWQYWSPKACFTIREHVTDDTVGLHTVPEDVETGEYIINDSHTNRLLQDSCVILGTTKDYYFNTGGQFVMGGDNGGGTYGGVKTAYKYYLFSNTSSSKLADVIQGFAENNGSDAIGCIFTAPFWMIPRQQGGAVDDVAVSETYSANNLYWDSEPNLDPTITKPTTVNGYTPKNKKLLTYPFSYFIMSNNNGSNAILKYELFSTSTLGFIIKSVPTPSMSAVIIPLQYNGKTENYGECIAMAKYPICGYNTDVYTNWLRQNGVNYNSSVITSGLQMLGGIGLLATGAGALAGAGMITGGALSIASTVTNLIQHSKIPPQADGNLNTGDVAFATGNTSFTYYKMSVRDEYARIIDETFTRTGYKINRLKVPNMEHRENYNYVQIASEENVAYPNNYNNIGIPADALNQINEMFRNGITLWNNHTNFGDYSVSNNITS